MLKVTTECSFQLKWKLHKQAEGCLMGGPLSVTLANLIQTEKKIVKSLKLRFYGRYTNDTCSNHRKNCSDQLYHDLNNYHPN